MSISPQNAEEVAQRWSQVDFEELQKNLHEEVQAIDLREDESKTARLQLVTESKNYYEHADKESRKAVSPLIKAFQTEYDRATERAKAAETRLILLCRAFTSVSDPSPYLEQIPSLLREVERLRSADEQVGNLNRQLKELREEYGDLQNQELTVRQLREQVKELEEKANSSIQAAVSEKEKELHADVEEFKKEMTEKHAELNAENRKLTNAIADLETKNKEANRLLEETKHQLVNKEAVNDTKLEIVTKDLDSALQRATEAEAEMQRLQNELKKKDRSSPSINAGTSENSSLIRSKDNQIRKLLEENKKLNDKLVDLKSESDKRVDELTQQLERHVELVAQLRAQLEAQSDYEDNKKELRILRSIEFGEENEDGGNYVSNGVTTTATATAEVQLGGRSKALDELLVGKNRKLQSENAELRMRNQKLEEESSVMDGKELVNIFGATGLNTPSSSALCNKDITLADLLSSKSTKKSLETSGALDLEGDPQCATNLLNLLMSSTAQSSQSSSKLDSYSTSTYNIHELPRTPAELKAYNELQNVVNRNIQELGSRALNTTEVARQCKNFMNTHNIGQRLFAKFVMNQVVKSQGSLSELLSKPRHWNKLTDKGREAFRRMYGWVSDSKAIELLCAVSPRRTTPLGSFEIEAPARESLWDQQGVSLAAVTRYNAETSMVDRTDKQLTRATATAEIRQRERSSIGVVGSSGNSSAIQRTSRWRHDDISKEKIMKIYKRELALLNEQASHLEQAIGPRPSSVRSRDEKFAGATESTAPVQHSAPSSLHGSSRETRSPSQPLNFPLNPAQTLFALKCCSGMTPITQEQLERYAVLDTEDVVRQIKDFLCLNSISQRQFGEHVLGLSQGSVSDLLARPKPWAMLTQKGREPFIRMQLFLNEAQSIAFDRETGNIKKEIFEDEEEERHGERSNPDLSAKETAILPSETTFDNDVKPNAVVGRCQNIQNSPLAKDDDSEDDMDDEDEQDDQAQSDVSPQVLKKDDSAGEDVFLRWLKKEMIAKGPSTNEIARRVRDRLHSSGISQKAFGDVVLGVSPGVVSDLLSKPKTWGQLSPRILNLYLRMNEWLDVSAGTNSSNVSLPSAFVTALSKYMEAGGITSKAIATTAKTAAAAAAAATATTQKRKSSANLYTLGEIPKKAQRTVITDQQKDALKQVFERDQHPNQRTIEQLSQTLGLSTRTVSNWFHNYRTRQKASLRAKNAQNGGGGDQKRIAAKEKTNDRWQQDLAELIKMDSKQNPFSPTMVPSTNSSNLTRTSANSNTSAAANTTKSSGSLHNIVEKLKLNATRLS